MKQNKNNKNKTFELLYRPAFAEDCLSYKKSYKKNEFFNRFFARKTNPFKQRIVLVL